MRKILVLLAGLALLAAACNGDDGTEETTTTAAPETTTTTAVPETTTTTTAGGSETTSAAPTTVVWAGITFDPARYVACLGATSGDCSDIREDVMTDDTVEINRELYGQLLEFDEGGPDPTFGPVIFREVSGVPLTAGGATAGCTYLRHRIFTSFDPRNDPAPEGFPDLDYTGEAEPIDGTDPQLYGVAYGDDIDPYELAVTYEEVSLHYVFLPAPRWKWAPDDDPVPIEPPAAPVETFAGPGNIVVIDAFDDRPELEGVQFPATGHGKFIVSVIADLTESVSISDFDAAADIDGRVITTELSLHEEVTSGESSLTTTTGSVINASFGVYACDDEGGDPMDPALLPFSMDIVVANNHLVVAAAGNDSVTSNDRRFYPAGYATDSPSYAANVVSVGACDIALVQPNSDDECTKHRADFSNSGDWVEVWAPGVHIPGAFEGRIVYTYEATVGGNPEPVTDDPNAGGIAIEQAMSEVNLSDGNDVFSAGGEITVGSGGAVQWAGTSFAAPHVAAAIAGTPPLEGEDIFEVCNRLFQVIDPGSGDPRGACTPAS